MTEEQMQLLVKWVEAMIDMKIEEAFGRDSLNETLSEDGLRQAVRLSFGLSDREQPY